MRRSPKKEAVVIRVRINQYITAPQLRVVMETGENLGVLSREEALSKAKEAAGKRNVKIMGGANTINQYLKAGLIDELWLHIVPVTIGKGTRLFEDVPDLKLEPIEVSGTSVVTHIRYKVLK